MLGRSSSFADECRINGFIGANFDIDEDLTENLTDDWREFNKIYIPKFLAANPEKSKTAAGVSCSFLYTICKSLQIGDTILSPDGKGNYYVGSITSDYYYVSGEKLPHRRSVQWMNRSIKRNNMSEELRHSSGSIGTCCDITRYAEEIESLIMAAQNDINTIVKEKKDVPIKKHYLERDLHLLFCNYLRSRGIIGKTIYHEQSSTRRDSNQKWVHPDIVGVKFEDFTEETTKSLQKVMEPKNAANLYSFEMKCSIEDDYQLKQYFFQALSNSSWANYGYLVAYEIDEALMEEIHRLNAAFGIGVILLKAKPEETEILFQAKLNELDYNTIDKLCHLNDGFKTFVAGLTKVMKASKEYVEVSLKGFMETCDPIFNNTEEIEKYCLENSIPY